MKPLFQPDDDSLDDLLGESTAPTKSQEAQLNHGLRRGAAENNQGSPLRRRGGAVAEKGREESGPAAAVKRKRGRPSNASKMDRENQERANAAPERPTPTDGSNDRAGLSLRPGGIVNAYLLGSWLGITKATVELKANEGAVERVSPGRYDLQKSVTKYCAALRHTASARTSNSTLTAARIRATDARASRDELKNAEIRRELLRATDVENAWAGILRDVRAGMLAIPGRLAARINLSQHDISEIDREIRLALEAVGNGKS